MILQAISAKVVLLAGQIALAWLLLEEDFGLYGLSMTVVGFVAVVEQAGIREVLVQRFDSFARWSTAAFWLSVASGLIAMSLIVVLAPVAARAFDEPRVVGLMLVLAAAMPFKALGIVPHAKLQGELRFKTLATISWFRAVGEMLLTLFLAWKGFGAYSFVVPRLITTGLSTVSLWVLARPRIERSPRFARWRFLIGDSFLALCIAFVSAAILQGDYIILGLLFSAEVVGVYYLGYRMSTQLISIVNVNLAQVLLPGLVRWKGDLRGQTRRFLSGLRELAFLSVPLCLLQAALADPAMRMVFEDRWYPAIPVVQALSVGMAFHAVGGITGGTLLRAQRRFGTLLRLTLIRACIFLVCVLLGAFGADLIGVAIGVCVAFALTSHLNVSVGIRPGGGGWQDFWRAMAPPFMLGGISVAVALAVTQLGGRLLVNPIWEVIAILSVFSCIHIGLATTVMPRTTKAVLKRARSVLRPQSGPTPP